MRGVLIAIALGCAALSVACGGSRASGICADLEPDPKVTGDAAALAAEGEAAYAQRGDEAQLRKAIEAWEKSLKLQPNQPDLRVKLSRAHYFLADGHLRFKDEAEAEMIEHFEVGANHAELALGQKYPAYRSKYCARRPLKTALAQLDKGAVPAMYWFATNLGKYGLAKSIVVVLNEKDRIKAMMDLVHSMDPEYYYGAADRYFGSYYTKIPFPNGDLPTSRKHFEASMKLAPNYFATKVLFAELYAIKAKEKELFEKLLTEVVEGDPNVLPDVVPEQKAEQKKAKLLLDELFVYFPED